MTYTVQLFILILAFEKISPLQSFAASSSAMLVKTLLPISLGDIGIRESASVYFYAKMGISKATAFDASFILFILNILFPSFVGLVIVLRDKWNGKKRLQSGLS